MSRHNDDRRSPDPLTILTQGMRRMASLRLDDIARGFENLAHPSARGMLESMGRTREQQVATMVEMLRNSSEADIEEMGQVFAEAMARLAEERASAAERSFGRASDDDDAARRRRERTRLRAAERRRQRRLAS